MTTSPLANNAFTFAQEPSSPALTPVFSNVTVNSLDLSFTSGGNAAQYLVVRKKDSAPTGILSDGSVYTVNTSFGDGTIVQIGPALSLSQSGLEEGANYFYSVYPFNGSAGTTNYLVVNVLTGNQQTIQYVAPSLQPTGFTTSDVSANSFSVTFTPSIATEGYIVLRKTVSSPASVPVNGTTYAINGTFADGSDIVSVGSATTFLQTGLTGATAYFYDVYAYNGFGVYTKFKTVSPLEGSGATLQTEPGGQPTNLLFSNVSTNSFGVSFTAATASPSANGYLVLRNDIESPQFIPQDGTIYSMANAKQSDGSDVVQFGNISTFTETGLSPGKKYYYKVFSLRGTGATTNYLADFPLEGNQSTSQISAPTSQPTSLSFSSITETGLQVSFTAASGGPGGYLAIRRNGSAPTGTPQNDNVYNVGDAIGDGIVAFFDNATSFSDAGLNPGTTYFYKIFSYNRDGGQVKVQLASPLNGSQSTSAAQPSDQATALSFGMVTNNSLDVSFSAASSSPAGYLVLRRSGSVSTDFPVDGVNYTVGSALVSSTIAFVGSGLTFSESGLTSATNYFYSVFSFNGSGNSINYLTTAPLTSNIKTLALEPASQPTALVFSTLTATSLNVSFSAATGSPIGYIVLKRATAPPTETPVDGTSYTAGNLLGSSTIASVGGGLSFSESGLTAATVYYYKIFSFNGTAETVNYKVDNPLTASQSTLPAAPSSQAESITFSTITSSSIKVSFTNGNGNSRLLVAKSGSVVDGLPVNTTTYTANNAFGSGSPIGTGNFVVGIGSGSQTIAGLKPGTNYHFQVFEFNGTGGLENYNTTVATGNPAFSTIPLDTSKPLVTDKTNGIISSGNNISIVVTLTDTESEIAAAKVMFKAISGGAFTPLDLTAPTSGLDYTQTIPWNISFDLGVEYKFEVTNGAGLKNETVPLKTVKVISGSGLTIPCNCAGTSEENYKVIAVPLDLANNTVGSVFDELMPFDESKWRISHYENGDNKELIASSPIEPGKGYWLLVAEPGKTFNTGSGNSVSAASDSQFSVDLKTGWNQIGNPYNYNLSWADMQAANTGFSGVKLRKYSGGWSDGTQLNKMEGAFIEASASQTKLIFPVTKNASINGRISDEIKSPQYPLNNNNWQVYLNIEQGGWSSKISGVGMNEDALVGKDIFDGFAMPRMFKSYLEANHIKKSSDIYSFDVVPTSENHIWDMEVESNLKDDIKFSWDNSYFGSNDRELYLFDVALQLGIDMRRTNSYTIRRDISKSFKVLFGHKDFIKEQTSVERLVLHSLSPNPTEGDVTISFTLPGVQQDYNIDVEVVNLMGIKIWSYSNTMQSGFHKIIWRRDQPETGALYLVKVKAGSMTDAKKLIIIR